LPLTGAAVAAGFRLAKEGLMAKLNKLFSFITPGELISLPVIV